MIPIFDCGHWIAPTGGSVAQIFHKEVAMDFKDEYPEYAAIEGHIRKAHALRAVVVSHAIVAAIESMVRGLKSVGKALGEGYAERERRIIEADAFLKRSVPRY
jgi:hypothetical protein